MKSLDSMKVLVIGDTQDVVVQTIVEASHADGAAVSVVAAGTAVEPAGYDGVVFVTPPPAEDLTFSVYLHATVDAAQRAADTLEQVPSTNSRSIVMVGRPADDDSLLTIPGAGAVSGALRGLSRGWAVSLGGSGIRSNWVQPGLAHTTDPDGWTVPLEREDGRNVLPRDLANVVIFLLSQDADYVNGAEFDVDGGLSEARRSLPAAQWSTSFAERA